MSHVLRSIIRISGIMLIVLGASMLVTCLVCLLCGETRQSLPYCLIGGAVLLAGILCRTLCRRQPGRLHIGDGFLIVVLLWLLMSAIGALPYLATGTISDPVSAFFESCSGFTTTGATVLTGLKGLPHGILFWRSMTCWLGGIGMLLLAITLMPALGLNGQRLNTPDNYGPVLEQVSPRMIDSIRTIITVYTGLTLLETILLVCGGMTVFNGLLHSMSTVSTGGFSRYDEGIAHFDGLWIPLIISLFMIASGLNYHLILRRPKNSLQAFFGSSEIRLYGVLLAASFLLVSAALIRHYPRIGLAGNLSQALFHCASFLSTTGMVNADYCHWPQLPQTLLLLLMFCGACTASPGGGIKAARVSILLKLVRHGVSTRLHANYFETVKMNGQGMGTDTVSGAATMPFLFLTALFAGTFALTFDHMSLSSAFNAAMACLCNTGHAFGTLGLGGTFASFGAVSKGILSLLMIGGRLELYAIVILLTPTYWTQGR